MTTPIKLTVRTADQTRRADITLDGASTGADVLQGAVDNWSLPADTDYSLVNVSTGQVLNPREALDPAKVKQGDVLEVQPVLVAGWMRSHYG
jgi:hypothetical protein